MWVLSLHYSLLYWEGLLGAKLRHNREGEGRAS